MYRATVTTPHIQLTDLSGSATPFDMVFGTRSVLTGKLTRVRDGAGLAGQPVLLSRRVEGTTGAFLPVGPTRTASDGSYRFEQIPGNSFTYRISFAGNADYQPAVTDKRLRIWLRTSISISAGRAAAGSHVAVLVHTAPALDNGKTYLDRAVQTSNGGNTSFVRLGPHNTDSTGTVRYIVTVPPKHVTWKYLVEIAPPPPYLPSSTTTVSVTGS